MTKILYGIAIIVGTFLGIYAYDISQQKLAKDLTKNTQAQTFRNVQYRSLNHILEDANIILQGKIVDVKEETGYAEYIVDVNKFYKGAGEKLLKLKNYIYEYEACDKKGNTFAGATRKQYKKGKEYIFILQEIDNVYEREYFIMDDTYLPVNDPANCTIYSKKINVSSSLEKYINQYRYLNKSGEDLNIEYTKSKQCKDIIDTAKYIVKLRVKNKQMETDDTFVSECQILESLKGDINSINNKIFVTFFKNTVKVGEEYIVNLNSDTEQSLIYSLSAKNGIYSLNMKNQIVRYLKD